MLSEKDKKFIRNYKEKSFYGGTGYDIICFDNKGQIRCSGKKTDMLKYAREKNWACAKLTPLRFVHPLAPLKSSIPRNTKDVAYP
jgi:hypothetical protein